MAEINSSNSSIRSLETSNDNNLTNYECNVCDHEFFSTKDESEATCPECDSEFVRKKDILNYSINIDDTVANDRPLMEFGPLSHDGTR